MHFSKQGFRSNILPVRPCYRTVYNAHLIQVMNIFQFTKNTVIEIGFQIKDTLAPILDLNLNAVV